MSPMPDIYPCEFPIKVMGRNDGTLRADTRPIIERHAGPVADTQIRERLSADSNFVALTYVVQAQNRDQLDRIYRELTALKSVLMAL